MSSLLDLKTDVFTYLPITKDDEKILENIDKYQTMYLFLIRMFALIDLEDYHKDMIRGWIKYCELQIKVKL